MISLSDRFPITDASPLKHPDFAWDGKRYRYTSGPKGVKGTFVSPEAIANLTQGLISTTAKEISVLGDRLIDGKIGFGTFQRKFLEKNRVLHSQQYLLGRGGMKAMTPPDYARINKELQSEAKYFREFAKDIKKGQSAAQIQNRLRMYVEASKVSYANGAEAAAIAAGYDQEENILHPAEHCPECLALTKGGPKPIGTMPKPGTRECMRFCKCTLKYSKSGKKEDAERMDKPCGKGFIADWKKCLKGAEETGTSSASLLSIHRSHVINSSPIVSTIQINSFLDELADKDNSANIEKYKKFIELNKTKAIFYNFDESVSEVSEKKLAAKLSRQAIQTPRMLVTNPSSTGSGGYTAPGANHVVVCPPRHIDSFSPSSKDLKKRISDVLSQEKNIDLRGFAYTENSSNETFATYLHEIGHQVHFASGTPSRGNPNAVNIKEPSPDFVRFTKYSAVNGLEYVAEHFIPWVIAPKEFKKADPAGYKWMDAMVNRSLKRKRF